MGIRASLYRTRLATARTTVVADPATILMSTLPLLEVPGDSIPEAWGWRKGDFFKFLRLKPPIPQGMPQFRPNLRASKETEGGRPGFGGRTSGAATADKNLILEVRPNRRVVYRFAEEDEEETSMKLDEGRLFSFPTQNSEFVLRALWSCREEGMSTVLRGEDKNWYRWLPTC